ncbi:MAG: diphthine--ammonia ligase [Thermoprotei archaeon]|nr:MAG: diphthine--ammonia ligase [Thermoprotei archaeon]RLF23313.1 MAG: diphthine--ammonia ligase [Thermoprotei archaeon]
MTATCLWSGGKDSAYACYLAMKSGVKISCITTFYPQDPESMLFHVPNVRWTSLQVQALGLPHILVSTPKGEELEQMRRVLEDLKERYGVKTVVSGVMASKYQRDLLRRVCEELSLDLITPLWGRDPIGILESVIKEGFKAIVIGVYAEGLTAKWLGRLIDYDMLNDLKKLVEKWKIHACGEGGEYETFVLDTPFFKKRVEILDYEVLWRRNWGELVIKDAKLVDK